MAPPFSYPPLTEAKVMALKGLFLVGFSKSEILAALNAAKEQMMEGKTIMAYGEGTTNVTKQFSIPPEDLLLEAQYALQTLFPAEYGAPTSQWTANTYRGMRDY